MININIVYAKKKDYAWNPSACTCEIDKYFKMDTYMKSITDHAVIACDEVIDTTETLPINFNDKKATYKKDYYNLHTFCK